MANNLDASYVPTKIKHQAAIGLECGGIKVSASYNRNKHEAPIVSEYGVQAELVRSAKRICFGVDETVRDCCPRCDEDCMNNQGSPATSIPSPIAVVLSKMRMNEQDANIQTECCAELWNLAYNNESNQVTIAEAGGITTILSAMKTHSSHATVQEHGCFALQNLAFNNDKNQVTIADAGGITTILSAMKTHSSNATVQEKGCGTLLVLALNDNNKVTIAEADGKAVIESSMRNHPSNADVQENGNGALCNLTHCGK